MGIFDFLKKKKETETYDPTNIKLTDLKKNFIFEYDLKTWVVDEEYQYDWGNNFYSKEYKVNNGEDEYFLSVDEDDGIFITLTQKVKVRVIQEDLPEIILKSDKPPKTLEYKGTKFYYDEESIGSFNDLSKETEEEAKFISWEYYDENDKLVLTIEQWGEEEFEASYGKVLKEFEISNIIPGNN